MRFLRRFLIRLSNFATRRSADQRLQEELAEHLAFQTEENLRAVEQAATGIAAIARVAESHASAAEEVTASSEEQSAACEQMSATAATLHRGAMRLRELVDGLGARTNGNGAN